MQHEWLLFVLIALIVAGVWVGLGLFSRDARLERRRRKSHSRIVSKSDRPMVRFSVKTPKKK
jgi:hypothetical protein